MSNLPRDQYSAVTRAERSVSQFGENGSSSDEQLSAEQLSAEHLSAETWRRAAVESRPVSLRSSVIADANAATVAPEPQAANTSQEFNWYTPVAPPVGPFDGRLVCNQVVTEFGKHHIDLVDHKKRQDWAGKWSDVCEKDPRLETEKGTDEVGEQIAKSLGHSYDAYMDRAEYVRWEQQNRSTAVSIGAELAIWKAGDIRESSPYDVKIGSNHPLIVRSVLPDSPAAKAGLETGDKIVAVNGTPVTGKTRREVIFGLSEKENIDVKLEIERTSSSGVDSRQSITVKPAIISIPPVEHEVLQDGIHRVKLTTFTGDDVIDKVRTALEGAATSRGLILDLRNNGGGSTSNARDIVSMLLPTGTIMTARERTFDGAESFKQRLEPDGLLHDRMPDHQNVERTPLIIPKDMPIVVLVDEYTASSSEITAGALANRATIMGIPTTAKREGQLVTPIDADRGVVVTSFEFRPGDETGNVRVITPHIKVENTNPKFDTQRRAAENYLRAKLGLKPL